MVLDGAHVPAYIGAFESRGRVFVPLRPFVTKIADRVWFDGSTLLVERNGRVVRIRSQQRAPDALDHEYVAMAPLARELGGVVRYDPEAHEITVSMPKSAAVAMPTPFNPAVPTVAPAPVFTPVPGETPRPVWTGIPLPRRTPLPYPT